MKTGWRKETMDYYDLFSKADVTQINILPSSHSCPFLSPKLPRLATWDCPSTTFFLVVNWRDTIIAVFKFFAFCTIYIHGSINKLTKGAETLPIIVSIAHPITSKITRNNNALVETPSSCRQLIQKGLYTVFRSSDYDLRFFVGR